MSKLMSQSLISQKSLAIFKIPNNVLFAIFVLYDEIYHIPIVLIILGNVRLGHIAKASYWIEIAKLAIRKKRSYNFKQPYMKYQHDMGYIFCDDAVLRELFFVKT